MSFFKYVTCVACNGIAVAISPCILCYGFLLTEHRMINSIELLQWQQWTDTFVMYEYYMRVIAKRYKVNSIQKKMGFISLRMELSFSSKHLIIHCRIVFLNNSHNKRLSSLWLRSTRWIGGWWLTAKSCWSINTFWFHSKKSCISCGKHTIQTG